MLKFLSNNFPSFWRNFFTAKCLQAKRWFQEIFLQFSKLATLSYENTYWRNTDNRIKHLHSCVGKCKTGHCNTWSQSWSIILQNSNVNINLRFRIQVLQEKKNFLLKVTTGYFNWNTIFFVIYCNHFDEYHAYVISII